MAGALLLAGPASGLSLVYNMTVTGMSLAHVGYEVATPALVSVVLTRTEISTGSMPGTGSTLGAVAFGPGTANQEVGTIACTPGFLQCRPQAPPVRMRG